MPSILCEQVYDVDKQAFRCNVPNLFHINSTPITVLVSLILTTIVVRFIIEVIPIPRQLRNYVGRQEYTELA